MRYSDVKELLEMGTDPGYCEKRALYKPGDQILEIKDRDAP